MIKSYILNPKLGNKYQEDFYQYYMQVVLGSKDIIYGETLMSDKDE